jgi:hypothetical protein
MRPRMMVTGAVGVVLLLGGAATYSVVNASGPGGGAFNDQASEAKPGCMVHQKEKPGKDYTGGAAQDTGKVLRMLRYYSVNGNKAYCDGKAATSTDQAWARLYVDLGADPTKVTGVTG